MRHPTKRLSRLTIIAGILLLAACVGPQGKPQDTAAYLLSAALPATPGKAKSTQTLFVSPMRAHPGFDTPRMVYLREPNRLEHFAYNRWVEAPARMLTPLLTQALEAGNAFGSVVQAPGSAHAQLRLDTELVNLTQDFSVKPSRMRLVLRAQIVDTQTHGVRASRVFDVQAAAASEDARGGVEAVNRILPALLTQLAEWAAQAGATRP